MEALAGFFTAILPVATVLSLALSAVIGLLAFRRSDVREHHRWLQEKRREAYVDFLSTTRAAYGRISSPDRAGKDNLDVGAIDRDESDVWYALNVLEVVGPREMAEKGLEIVFRLKMDRLYYSPTRDKQLAEDKERILQRAEATGDARFARDVARAYDKDPFDIEAYKRAHDQSPLQNYWGSFANAARKELALVHPGRWHRLRRVFSGAHK